jgi:hypothetical protein
MSVAAVSLTGAGEARADALPTTVTTSLSDGTDSGTSLTEQAGTPVTDTAALAGDNASTATGTVTYNVYSDAACMDPVSSGTPETITTPGMLPQSASVTLNIPGAYYWQAVYSGDSGNAASDSSCGPNGEVETVPAGSALTSVSATLTGGGLSGPSISVQAGTTVTDTASLSGDAAGSATGTVTYDVYSDSACMNLVNSGTAETITTPGTLPPSAGVTLTTAGTYYWQASYSGDAVNAPSVSGCGDEVETVTPAETMVATSLSGQPSPAISVPAGTAVTDMATLSGINSSTATGNVTYTVYSDPACNTEVNTATVPITTPGTLPESAPVTLTNVGTYYWQAAYSGDTGNAPSVSPCGPAGEVETVTAASIAFATSLSGGGGQPGTTITVPSGTAVTDTATLSGTDANRATGSVTFTVYADSACTMPMTSATVPITPGVPPESAPVTLTIAGAYYWQVSYSGDPDNVASASPCGPSGAVETVTPVQQSTALAGVLSGGGQVAATLTVPAGTAVTDTASLTGTDAGVATGSVTYTVYSNPTCTAAVSTGTAEPITTPGTPPASAPVSLSTTGTYYWRASYSGDANNASATSPCGKNAETVTPAPTATTLTTSLLSAAKSGTSITVQAGTPVRDSAHLTGTNAAKATGTVTYKVYSNAACSALVASGSVTVTGGVVPSSPSESLIKPGTYYWTATYSGDPGNKPSASGCGAQTQFVTPAPVVDSVSSARASHTASVSVSTTAAGDLLVAFVSGRGPAGKSQSASVSSSGLRWTFVGRENTGRGDAEVWDARAAGALHNLRVTTTERYSGSTVTLTVVAFKNAGIGKHAAFHSGSGAPTGTLATSKNDSLVFAVGDDWLNSASRTPGAGQAIDYQSTDSAHDTYWVQATKNVAPNAGTRVTINDTKPPKDPYNLFLVEILWG